MHLQIGDVELSKTLLDVAARALPEAFQFSEHAAAGLRLQFLHDFPNGIIRNQTPPPPPFSAASLTICALCTNARYAHLRPRVKCHGCRAKSSATSACGSGQHGRASTGGVLSRAPRPAVPARR